MSIRPDVLAAILVMALASHACRFGGFLLMRYVTITPRVETWLRAIPIALIGAILGPIAARGGLAEWLGLGAALGATRLTGNEFAGVVAGVSAVVTVRALSG